MSDRNQVTLNNPIFIIGCPRSGTTLLQRMLDAHPEIAIAPETHFMQYFWQRRVEYGALNQDDNFQQLLAQITTSPEFAETGINEHYFRQVAWDNERTYKSLFQLLLQQYRELKNVSLVGEKTPNHVLFLSTLQEFFPNARFINIIRDPRAVVNSWRSVPWSSGNLIRDAEHWRGHVRPTLRYSQSLESKVLNIFYERLVTESEVTLRSVCKFLNIEYTSALLTYHEKTAENLNLDREPWKKQVLNPVSLDHITKWQKELSQSEITQIEAVTWQEMRDLGYEKMSSPNQLFSAMATYNIKRVLQKTFSEKKPKKIKHDYLTKVVFLYTWAGNPYKELLSNSLKKNSIEVQGYRRKKVIFLPLNTNYKKVDILHLHTLERWLYGRNILRRLIKASLFSLQIKILKIQGTKIIWTVHELYNKLNPIDEAIIDRQLIRLGKQLDGIICHCNSVREKVVEVTGKTEGVKVIPHGNYIGSYSNQINQSLAREKLKLPSSSIIFLLFGGLYRYKGVINAIQAFQSLPNNKNAYLLIAGKPKEENLAEEFLSYVDKTSKIQFFLEEIPDEEIQVYFNACDCVLLPYQTFTTSGVALLAMSFARACIAPRKGFFGDMLDDSGAILYDKEDQQGLLKALETAIECQEKLEPMGEHNFTIAQKYNWDWVATETAALYHQCLDNS